ATTAKAGEEPCGSSPSFPYADPTTWAGLSSQCTRALEVGNDPPEVEWPPRAHDHRQIDVIGIGDDPFSQHELNFFGERGTDPSEQLLGRLLIPGSSSEVLCNLLID